MIRRTKLKTCNKNCLDSDKNYDIFTLYVLKFITFLEYKVRKAHSPNGALRFAMGKKCILMTHCKFVVTLCYSSHM